MSENKHQMNAIPEQLKRHWGWLLALGILFVLLGSLGLVMTVGLTLVSVLFLGILILIGGVSQIIDAFKSRQWSSFIWHALIAVFYLLAGGVMLYDPFLASTAITALLAALLIFIGIARIMMAVNHRHSKGWGWLILAGVLAIVLGVLILMQWPWSGLWVIGLFIAIDLLMNGWTYIVLALAIRQT